MALSIDIKQCHEFVLTHFTLTINVSISCAFYIILITHYLLCVHRKIPSTNWITSNKCSNCIFPHCMTHVRYWSIQLLKTHEKLLHTFYNPGEISKNHVLLLSGTWCGMRLTSTEWIPANGYAMNDNSHIENSWYFRFGYHLIACVWPDRTLAWSENSCAGKFTVWVYLPDILQLDEFDSASAPKKTESAKQSMKSK